jgi:hypothetical protein
MNTDLILLLLTDVHTVVHGWFETAPYLVSKGATVHNVYSKRFAETVYTFPYANQLNILDLFEKY